MVGLANGDMLLIGGRSNDGSYQNSIWRLVAASGTWTEDVALQKVSLNFREIVLVNPLMIVRRSRGDAGGFFALISIFAIGFQ